MCSGARTAACCSDTAYSSDFEIRVKHALQKIRQAGTQFLEPEWYPIPVDAEM